MKREGEGKFRKYFEKIKETSFKNELVKVPEIACTPLGRIMSNEYFIKDELRKNPYNRHCTRFQRAQHLFIFERLQSYT